MSKDKNGLVVNGLIHRIIKRKEVVKNVGVQGFREIKYRRLISLPKVILELVGFKEVKVNLGCAYVSLDNSYVF